MFLDYGIVNNHDVPRIKHGIPFKRLRLGSLMGIESHSKVAA
jgi:hypothetical protein